MGFLQTRIANQLAIKLGGHGRYLDTPAPGLLRSNEPPTDEEITALKQALKVAEARLKEVRTLASPGFRYHSQPLAEFIRLHKMVLSPARRLPPELLGEIFVQCLDKSNNLSKTTPPYVLSKVCQRWRKVALSLPDLWRHLPPLVSSASVNLRVRQRMACVEAHLERSGNAGLTFYFCKSTTPEVDDCILEALFRHSRRWERISLKISEEVCAHFSRVKGRLPSLSSLMLDIERHSNLHVDMFENAPNLREVQLETRNWSGPVELPWSQLIKYTETDYESKHLAEAISCASRLTHLDFRFKHTWAVVLSFGHISPVTMHNVTCFNLNCIEGGSNISILFSKLTLPALQDLSLHLPPIPVTDIVLNLITRSSCILRRLSIYSGDAYIDMLPILALTPELLHLNIGHMNAALVEGICKVQPGVGWSLVPRLASLHVEPPNFCNCIEEISLLSKSRCDLSFTDPVVDTSLCLPLQCLVLLTSNPFPCINLPECQAVDAAWNSGLKGWEDSIHQGIYGSPSHANVSRKGRGARVSAMIDLLLSVLEGVSKSEHDRILYLYVRFSFC